jgi:hypothetical protein
MGMTERKAMETPHDNSRGNGKGECRFFTAFRMTTFLA